MRQLLTKFWKWLNSFVPEKLPQGMTEFNRWVEEISELSGLPMNDKLRKISGTLILQLPPSCAYIPKRHVANLLKKAAANQVSVEAINLINEKEKQSNDAQEVDKGLGSEA